MLENAFESLADLSVGLKTPSPYLLLLALLVPLLTLMLLTWRRRRVSDVTQAPAVAGALPLLGNVLGVDRKHPHFTLTDWADVYGHVYRLATLRKLYLRFCLPPRKVRMT